MEVTLNEVGEEVRRGVRSSATVGGAVASAGVDLMQEKSADVDVNRDNPNLWADKAKSRIQFGYDADAEAERWWAEHGQRTIPVLARL